VLERSETNANPLRVVGLALVVTAGFNCPKFPKQPLAKMAQDRGLVFSGSYKAA
jgi:hypothetical protein